MAYTIRRTSLWIKCVIMLGWLIQAMSVMVLLSGEGPKAAVFFLAGWMVRGFAVAARWIDNE